MIGFTEIVAALSQALPGAAAQQRMGIDPPLADVLEQQLPETRDSAVLILLYPEGDQLRLVLTLRTNHVATHKGQISLPGGQRDPADPSLWQTALREAHEEIGVDRTAVKYVGALTPYYIAFSRFQVYPFVGWLSERPTFAPNCEVAQIIECPLSILYDPAAKGEEERVLHGRQVTIHFYRYREHIIWGATAMILSELELVMSNVWKRGADD